jgi:hypothetical protein
VYEFKIDTDGDLVADIAYRMRFTSDKNRVQSMPRPQEGIHTPVCL